MKTETIHGGDIYRNQVELDFSVNRNPFGVSKRVKEALEDAIQEVEAYPDIQYASLRSALSDALGVPEEWIVAGNGASELFLAIVHGLKPEEILIPVPSFYGYEWAAGASDAVITYYNMKDLCLGEDFLPVLRETGAGLLFLANPNNPVGNLLSPGLLSEILSICKSRGIVLVVDECFLEFVPENEKYSLISCLKQYENLIVVRAFTKLYAIPGVRLGYLLCAGDEIRGRIQRHLPEWNLSIFAERAGVAALKETAYVKRTVDFLETERAYLTERLRHLGITVYESRADYLLLRTKLPLYEELLQRGILIRDCRNYRGLGAGYYRVAVRLREENDRLLAAVSACVEKEKQ